MATRSFLYLLVIASALISSEEIWSDNMDSGDQWSVRQPATSSTSRKHCASAHCVYLSLGGMIQYNGISALNYHSVELQYSLKVLNFENVDKCTVSYSVNNNNDWFILKQYDSTDNGQKYTETVHLNKDADDQSTISLRFETKTTPRAYCYIDQLFMFGVAATMLPTKYPTSNPISARIETSSLPTNNPVSAISTAANHEALQTYLLYAEHQQNIRKTTISATDSMLSGDYIVNHWYYLTGSAVVVFMLCLTCLIIMCFLYKKQTHGLRDTTFPKKELAEISPPSSQITHTSACSLTQLTDSAAAPTEWPKYTQYTENQVPIVIDCISAIVAEGSEMDHVSCDDDDDDYDSEDLYEVIKQNKNETATNTIGEDESQHGAPEGGEGCQLVQTLH